MLKIFILALALPFISFYPAKEGPSEETGFCDGIKFVIGKLQNAKELGTLKDKPVTDGKFESKLKFAGWDIAYVTDNSDGLDFTCFSKTASETEIKKLFKDTRSELIECLKLDPEAANEDDAHSFSIMYFPKDGDPGNSKTLTFSMYFYPKDKESDSFTSLSIQNSKD